MIVCIAGGFIYLGGKGGFVKMVCLLYLIVDGYTASEAWGGLERFMRIASSICYLLITFLFNSSMILWFFRVSLHFFVCGCIEDGCTREMLDVSLGAVWKCGVNFEVGR